MTNVILFGNTFNVEKRPSNTSFREVEFSDKYEEVKHVEVVTLPLKDRSGLFHAALTSDTVLHFYLPNLEVSNLCTDKR